MRRVMLGVWVAMALAQAWGAEMAELIAVQDGTAKDAVTTGGAWKQGKGYLEAGGAGVWLIANEPVTDGTM